MDVLISRQRIDEAVARLAGEIRRDYAAGPTVLIGVLHGAFVFLADLARALDLPVEIGFVGLSSYGSGTISSGRMEVFHELRADITGRDVVLVEDIVDSGHSVTYLCDYLRQRRPASLRICSLLDKPARREVPVDIDYRGFTIPNLFIVGYGMDFNGQYRHLPDIRVLEETATPPPPARAESRTR
jgi:hypoxanthine phosphoribosyltransferase